MNKTWKPPISLKLKGKALHDWGKNSEYILKNNINKGNKYTFSQIGSRWKWYGNLVDIKFNKKRGTAKHTIQKGNIRNIDQNGVKTLALKPRGIKKNVI